tara:strand:- start:413517 stop:415472 length:1956 start_codon:yes stop_codon:yes gene_type:complete
MSERIAVIGMISGALLATFFGGFSIAFAAPVNVSFTIDGESTSTLTVGETKTFEIQLANTDEVTVDADLYILDDTDTEISGLSNVSCGDGEDISDLGFEPIVYCFWNPGFAADETVSFDVVIDDEGDYTFVVFTLNDDPDSDGVEKEFALTAEAAVVANPFTFDSAKTYDEDDDGFIDTIKPEFSTVVDRTTLTTDDVTVDGYTVSAVGHWEFGLELNLDEVMITVTENSSIDSGATPDVTISGISDTDGNELDETTVTPTDGVSPLITAAEITQEGDKINVTFSEDLHGTTVNSTGTDFSLSENTITAADEISPGVVELTLASTTEATSIDVELVVGAINPGSVEDLNENKAAEQTISSTREADTTPIDINFVGLTTNATSTDAVLEGDTITLTFALAETAATTTVAILDESDVAVATGTPTSTATYTVDADTAEGAVTFTITVLDEAGNSSTATSTTDGSSLTVDQPDDAPGGGGGGDSSIPFSIDLTSANGGLNLISLPVNPADTSIASVLSGISSSVESVWTYIDGVWYVYYPGNPDLSNLTTMEAGFGYFIEVSADVTLSGSGEAETDMRDLDIGWQLVGYLQPDSDTTEDVSIDTAFAAVGLAGIAYSDLVGYEDGANTTPTAVSPGDGFWMNVVDGETVLAIPA